MTPGPVLERLFPRAASNDYRGSRIALYVFPLLAVVMAGRSLIHYFKADAGLNSIASLVILTGTPDPNPAVYLFGSLWGSQQLITVLIYAVVLIRYRNLIPLMYALMIVEVILRIGAGLIHPLGAEYFAHRPPGAVGNLPLAAICALMLALSLRFGKSAATESRIAQGAT